MTNVELRWIRAVGEPDKLQWRVIATDEDNDYMEWLVRDWTDVPVVIVPTP